MPVDELLKVMAALRNPEGGCPWDREQDFASIAPYTLEEAYEVADAIARDDMGDLQEELGDLLFQVVFHAQMAKEAGHFDFADVAAGIVAKMVRRHPHVFGDESIADAEAQTAAWEKQKAAERAAKGRADAPASALDGIARTLPALSVAEKLQKRAARVGFDWPDARGPLAKIHEECEEIAAEVERGSAQEHLAAEVGDLLFACVNFARHLGVDPEEALRRGNRKFERRFRAIETALAERGSEPAEASLEEMDALWEAAKRRE